MYYKSLGIVEVVFGILTKENEVDIDEVHKLAETAYPMKVTFHKAIDKTKNLFSALEKIKTIPEVNSILTSGGKSNAKDGHKIIQRMIDLAEDKIKIIAAGGITDQNFEELHNMIGAKEYHGKRIVGHLT